MANYSCKFIYDDKLCSDYGLIVTTFEKTGLEKITSSKIDLKTYKSPMANKWLKYGYEYSDPIQFKIGVSKFDLTPFTKQEVGEINRWLMRTDDYHWLQFYDKQFGDIFFHCTAIAAEESVVNSVTYGIKYSFVTDSPYGYSSIREKEFVATDTNKSFFIVNHSDEIGHIYPYISIKILQDGDLTIHNTIEDRLMEIKECKNGELITIDGEHKIMSTSDINHKLYNTFNWKYFRIANSFDNRDNKITLSLNCEISMKWREIRKVGV